jgi:hypothetical protein
MFHHRGSLASAPKGSSGRPHFQARTLQSHSVCMASERIVDAFARIELSDVETTQQICDLWSKGFMVRFDAVLVAELHLKYKKILKNLKN